MPGVRSSRVHVVDVATDPRAPRIHKVIEPEELKAKTGLSAPHTVHCMPGNNVVMSMLGDADGNDGAGFAVLDAETFEVKGRWEADGAPRWNYDFWYNPRNGYLVSSEWAAPNTFQDGFDLEDVAGGRYGHSIHIWDLDKRQVVQDIDLGSEGMIPLEIRWLHRPDADEGFVGAALSSTMWLVRRGPDGRFGATKVIESPTRDLEGFPVPVPGLITDLVVSMDDRYLYFSHWLHGDLRQYDISDPANPVLKSSVQLGGLFEPATHPNGTRLTGGPRCCSCPWTAAACTSPTRSTAVGTISSTRTYGAGCSSSTPATTGSGSTPTSSSTSTRPGPTRSTCRAATPPPRSSADLGGSAT